MRAIKKNIPNTLTLMNMLFGAMAIVALFNDRILLASVFIMIGGAFDFLDGFVARLLNVSSPIGKQLDSLSDMITFGAAPGFLALKLIVINDVGFASQNPILTLFPLMMIVMSGLRLAKFNIDTRQTNSFIGMPTPANAMFWVGLGLLYSGRLLLPHHDFLFGGYFIVTMSLLFSFFMVSEIRFLALKFGELNRTQIGFLVFLGILSLGIVIFSLICFQTFFLASLSLIILLYIIVSIIYHFTQQRNEL